jgi:hypothetical protein
VNACEPGRASEGALTETHNQQKMHGEKRGERYFIMHSITGAELTKLIDLKLVDRECGDLKLLALHQTTAHTKPKSSTCQG